MTVQKSLKSNKSICDLLSICCCFFVCLFCCFLAQHQAQGFCSIAPHLHGTLYTSGASYHCSLINWCIFEHGWFLHSAYQKVKHNTRARSAAFPSSHCSNLFFSVGLFSTNWKFVYPKIFGHALSCPWNSCSRGRNPSRRELSWADHPTPPPPLPSLAFLFCNGLQ